MWTKNWHRFIQGIYGACKRVDYNELGAPWAHIDEGIGIEPRYQGYIGGGLSWIDVFVTATNYQQTKLDTPPKVLIQNSQLDIPAIEYCSSNISAQDIYYKNAMCQLGSGQNADDYTAYNLATPITAGFTVQNITTGSTFDSAENKHKKTLSISLVNSSSGDITVSEFGLFLALSAPFINTGGGGDISPALVYYEKFEPVTISPGDVFRFEIEQEMPVLEVDTQ